MNDIVQEKWIPYDQRPAAWWIWNELYQVQIPYIQMLTIEELEEYGMPNSGDPLYDYGTANEMRQVMIPISEMVKYYHRGAQVYVCNPADCKRIYERISAHLIAWKAKLEKSLNIGDAPLEDLKLMDQFANAVYEHAKYQFTDDTISSLLSRSMDARHHNLTSLINSLEVPHSPNKNVQQEESAEDKYPQRESLAKFFEPYQNKRSTLSAAKPSSGLNQQPGSPRSMSDFLGGVPKYNN